ncbi:hypothetical protein QBC43DRAFT_297600 [Cladorrhinum sp. PSN259]|nr:hypothetical protein QBC43DRAFT_297600 [Cladorrhinum sp. PSN259]
MRKDSWPRDRRNNLPWNGRNLLRRIQVGRSPFQRYWTASTLVQLMERAVGESVIDIPIVTEGHHYLRLHFTLATGRELIVRLGRVDVNSEKNRVLATGDDRHEPYSDNTRFEAAVWYLLNGIKAHCVSDLARPHHPAIQYQPRWITNNGAFRRPVRRERRRHYFYKMPESRPLGLVPYGNPPRLIGRMLMVSRITRGGTNRNVQDAMRGPSADNRSIRIAAEVRASIFKRKLPDWFVSDFLWSRIHWTMETKFPKALRPSSSRKFWTQVFHAMIQTAAMKAEDAALYQILEAPQSPTWPFITVLPKLAKLKRKAHGTWLFEWDSGYIAPALIADCNWDTQLDPDGIYLEALREYAPEFDELITEGRNARYLWSKLDFMIQGYQEDRQTTSSYRDLKDLSLWALAEASLASVAEFWEGIENPVNLGLLEEFWEGVDL